MEFHSFVAAAAEATVAPTEKRLSPPRKEQGRRDRGTDKARGLSRVRRRAHNAAIYWPKFATPRFTRRRGGIAYVAIVEAGLDLQPGNDITCHEMIN